MNRCSEMKKSLNEIYRNEKNRENFKKTYERCTPIPADKSSHFESSARKVSSSVLKSTSKTPLQIEIAKNHELCCTVQAVLLASSVLVLSYNGALHGRSEYNFLEDGQTVSGSVPPDSAVVTLSLGYSAPYSIISSIAAVMLLYSLISKKSSWSLPSMVLCMADLVCDAGDAVVAIWLFFCGLRVGTAIFYSIGTVVIILGEFWIWLGVLRLYEDRTFT